MKEQFVPYEQALKLKELGFDEECFTYFKNGIIDLDDEGILEIYKNYSRLSIDYLTFTKLDETVSYGALFNILQTLDCPVSFFTTGQTVPNDIEVASGTRLAALLMGDESRGSTSE